MSTCQMEKVAIKKAKQLNDFFSEHIDISLSKVEGVRKLDEIDKENEKLKAAKRRKVGQRPKISYQAGDTIGWTLLHQAMAKSSKHSDSVTMDMMTKDGGCDNNKYNPRNIDIMMVLNDVSETSMNREGAKEKGCAKRRKPEFLLLSENKMGCKKFMTVFSEIFTTNQEKNKKDNYDLLWFKKMKILG